MAFRRAIDIDELFEQVQDYDLVLTVDAPLADALNARLNTPRVGHFAITPRRMVRDEHPGDLLERRDLFIELVTETDLSWKRAVYLLDRATNCWAETGDLASFTAYDGFDTEDAAQVVDLLQSTDNIFSAMDQYVVDDDLEVAVIAPEQFSGLDRGILPDCFTTYTLLTEETWDVPEFHVFSSPSAIVATLRDVITEENANDTAIVLDPDSPYAALIRASLDSAGIPFMAQDDAFNTDTVRRFLLLVRTATAQHGLRVRDIRPLLDAFDHPVSYTHDESYLAHVTDDDEQDALDRIKELLADVDGATFAVALEVFEAESGDDLGVLRDHITDLGLLDEPVTPETVSRLETYIDTYDVPVDRARNGVLLADAKTMRIVDRPIVCYLGMDAGWTHEVPEHPWIDREVFEERAIHDFQVRLQNGERQYFMVQDHAFNQPVTPCFYFNTVIDEDFERFTDLPHTRHGGMENSAGNGFRREHIETTIRDVETLSQSALNALVQCPRQYYFNQLVAEVSKVYFEKGNLFHDFAEFYVNHPDVVAAEGVDTFIDIMLERMRPHVPAEELPLLRTEFKVGVGAITAFIDDQGVEERRIDGFERRFDSNLFADRFDKSIDSRVTEMWFENPDVGGKGKVDLIQSPTHLVDYKSGRYKTVEKHVEQSRTDVIADYPNFQAVLYLAQLRNRNPGKQLRFTFYYFLNDLGQQLVGETDWRDNLVTITYFPHTFAEHAASEDAFDALQVNGRTGDLLSESNPRVKTLQGMGADAYQSFFTDNPVTNARDKDALLESDVAKKWESYAKQHVGDYAYVEKGCKQVLKQLVAIRNKNYFKEDVDAFESFLHEQLRKLNKYKRTRFPVGDTDLSAVHDRDLILR